jgi:hypothetical protein
MAATLDGNVKITASKISGVESRVNSNVATAVTGKAHGNAVDRLAGRIGP